jgi:hypothetical protein
MNGTFTVSGVDIDGRDVARRYRERGPALSAAITFAAKPAITTPTTFYVRRDEQTIHEVSNDGTGYVLVETLNGRIPR